MTFDQQALQTINNLKGLLHKEHSIKPPLILSRYTIGAEIEVKFRYFFPSIFEEYFENKKWYEYNEDERKHITELITEAEKEIKPLLDKTIIAGIPAGYDKYHEFAFNAVNDLTLLYYQIELLQKSNLIPLDGNHSLHLTIGNIDLTNDGYYILMVLQLMFLNKDRIIEGYDNKKGMNSTWAKKGQAGILKKNEYDLTNCDKGIEFRTLSINKDTDIYKMFKTLHFFLNNLEHNNKNSAIFDPVISKMDRLGLPNKNWGNPYTNKSIWDRYIETFDDLSSYTKNIVNNYI